MTHRLEELAPCPITLVWHENKATYLSVRKERGCLHFRLHLLFKNAPTPVLEALLAFGLKRDKKARTIIRQMAHLHFSNTTVDVKPLRAQGAVYNLQEIFDKMNEGLKIKDVSIGWSDRARTGKFRSMTFGTFDHHGRQIRIHPLLDDVEVPLYFLEFIVYHEMLHAVYPTVMDAMGRCSIHSKEFKEKERQFPDFKKAKEWEKASLIFFRKRKTHGRA